MLFSQSESDICLWQVIFLAYAKSDIAPLVQLWNIRLAHAVRINQASDIAKLWHEFLSLLY